MKELSFFRSQGTWFKGNIHSHTNMSDGVLSPIELSIKYINNGYSFIAITDHRIYGTYEYINRSNFIVLPGVELDIELLGNPQFCHHIIGLGLPKKNKFDHGQIITYTSDTTVKQLVAYLKDSGNLCIYAHPHWSHVEPKALLQINDLFGIEIFNTTCEMLAASGSSEAWFDNILWNGKIIKCFASDDTHQHLSDIGGGFIMVKAKSLTQEDIFDAILSGHFYASEAPIIYDFSIHKNKVLLNCSPCRSVGFLTNAHPGYAQNDVGGKIVEAEYNIRGNEKYIRAVCTDIYGRKAWTQPIELF